jgi:hypothetical protein
MRSLKIFLPLFLGILILAGGCKKKRDLSQLDYLAPFQKLSPDGFVLAFSSNLEGYVEPCGCTADPLGGVARFSQVFEDIRSVQNNNIALIAAGNLLFDSKLRNPADLCQDNARIDLLLSSLSKLGLKIILAGPLDNAQGEKYRSDWYKKFNLENLSENKGLKILAANNYNIALIPLLDEQDLAPESLAKTIKEMLLPVRESKKIQLVVVLSQLSNTKIKALMNDNSDVDIVIQANSSSTGTELLAPIKIDGGPWLIEGGRQGQYFTALVFQNLSTRNSKALVLDNRVFENRERALLLKARIKGLEVQLENAVAARNSFLKQKIEQARNELALLEKNLSPPPLKESSVSFSAIALNRQIESLPEIKGRLTAYEQAIPQLVKKCEENIECPKAAPDAATFVGAETCKSCHQQAYEVWQKAQFMSDAVDEDGKTIKRLIGHSKAWQTLVDLKKDADRSCIGCHSVGFMQAGGYCKVSEVGFRKNVQCESCHGAGSLHAMSGDKKLIQKSTEESCRICHQPPHIPTYESFHYEERLMKILGPGHGEQRLKELKLKSS